MLPSEIIGVAPWVIITAVVAWIGSFFTHRQKVRTDDNSHAHKVEVHRDDLTLQIIRTGREELALARVEVDDLREEVRKLRAMETHFFHFQQSLDHLEALLTAETEEARAAAERNATAFLKRMKRLQEAKGTLVNEAQRIMSEVSVLDRNQSDNYGERK